MANDIVSASPGSCTSSLLEICCVGQTLAVDCPRASGSGEALHIFLGKNGKFVFSRASACVQARLCRGLVAKKNKYRRWRDHLTPWCDLVDLMDLPPAPSFRPTAAQWAEPLAYLASIRHRAEPYGICKVREAGASAGCTLNRTYISASGVAWRARPAPCASSVPVFVFLELTGRAWGAGGAPKRLEAALARLTGRPSASRRASSPCTSCSCAPAARPRARPSLQVIRPGCRPRAARHGATLCWPGRRWTWRSCIAW